MRYRTRGCGARVGSGVPGVWWVPGTVDWWVGTVVRVRVVHFPTVYRVLAVFPLFTVFWLFYHGFGCIWLFYHGFGCIWLFYHCTASVPHCTASVPTVRLVYPTVANPVPHCGKPLYPTVANPLYPTLEHPPWLPLLGLVAGGSRGQGIVCRCVCQYVDPAKRRFIWK